jgi:hypothetical protein
MLGADSRMVCLFLTNGMVLGGKQQTPLGISYHVSQDPPATCRKLTELPKKNLRNVDLCGADFGVFLPTSLCPSQGHPALSKGTHFFEVVLCFAWTFSLHGVPELPHRESV